MRDATGSWDEARELTLHNGKLELELAPGQAVWLRPA